MALREVLIRVSNREVPNLYTARSYPKKDYNNNGLHELYEVPVYYVYIEGTDNRGIAVKRVWNALRFMPYWNDPKDRSPNYSTLGWANVGIHYFPKTAVTQYKPNYTIHNSPGFSNGAIVIKDRFYIHEGPKDLISYGAGSAGCIGIIGSFDQFKEDIKELSGCNLNLSADSAILQLIKERKLFLQIESATPPDIFKSRLMDREYDPITKTTIILY